MVVVEALVASVLAQIGVVGAPVAVYEYQANNLQGPDENDDQNHNEGQNDDENEDENENAEDGSGNDGEDAKLDDDASWIKMCRSNFTS